MKINPAVFLGDLARFEKRDTNPKHANGFYAAELPIGLFEGVAVHLEVTGLPKKNAEITWGRWTLSRFQRSGRNLVHIAFRGKPGRSTGGFGTRLMWFGTAAALHEEMNPTELAGLPGETVAWLNEIADYYLTSKHAKRGLAEDRTIAVSPKVLKAATVEAGVNPNRARVTIQGISVEPLVRRTEWGEKPKPYTEHDTVLLSSGNLSTYKEETLLFTPPGVSEDVAEVYHRLRLDGMSVARALKTAQLV